MFKEIFNTKKKENNMEKIEGYVENKELTLVENIEDLKEPNAETGYLMEFTQDMKGEDDDE